MEPPPPSSTFSSSLGDFLINFVQDSELVCHFDARSSATKDPNFRAKDVNSGAKDAISGAPNAAVDEDEEEEIYSVSKLEMKKSQVDLREMLIKDGFAVEKVKEKSQQQPGKQQHQPQLDKSQPQPQQQQPPASKAVADDVLAKEFGQIHAV